MEENTIKKVVAIGGSAGSLDVILYILSSFPVNSGAVVIVVVHRKNDADSILADLIAARTKIPVKDAEDKDQIFPDHIYLAPPNYHLLIENNFHFSLDTSEKIHFSRPSIDVTFESIAEIFEDKVIGILISGANADGALGLKAIQQSGGLTIAQDPYTAEVDYMPKQAIIIGAADKILSPEEMVETIKEELKK
jgi:two-component system, chemotaxis family, protein-glutamate methylesterase/glutaminase